MNKAHRELLNKRYNDVCEEYLKAFCDAYEMSYEKDSWVAGDVGTIACVGDYCFDFTNVIKYAVDNNLSDWHELLQWYDTRCLQTNTTRLYQTFSHGIKVAQDLRQKNKNVL